MKEMSIKVFYLTQDEVKNMEDGQKIIVFDLVFHNWHEDVTGKKCIANYKHVRKDLVYISLDEEVKFKGE